jgi:mono/diheme cytochrome c family protein
MHYRWALAAMFVSLALVTGCTAQVPDAATLPTSGDAGHGAVIFNQGVGDAPPCAACHRTDSSALVGPGLGGLSARAGSRVSGLSARDYVYQSIVSPARYLVSGYTNVMYSSYGEKLSPQDIADVMAYVLSLPGN